MSTKYLLPNPASILTMFKMLLGDNLSIKSLKPAAPDPKSLVGSYIDATGTAVAIAVCDPAFAAYAGSAMIMLPAMEAKRAVTGTLSDSMVSNTYELLNICTRLLMDDNTPHLKLAKLHHNFSELDESAKALLTLKNRADFEVTIPNYGSGKLIFLIT